jgi:hypothetical protein
MIENNQEIICKTNDGNQGGAEHIANKKGTNMNVNVKSRYDITESKQIGEVSIELTDGDRILLVISGIGVFQSSQGRVSVAIPSCVECNSSLQYEIEKAVLSDFWSLEAQDPYTTCWS